MRRHKEKIETGAIVKTFDPGKYGLLFCDKCGGSGRHDDEICEGCGGFGLIKETKQSRPDVCRDFRQAQN